MRFPQWPEIGCPRGTSLGPESSTRNIFRNPHLGLRFGAAKSRILGFTCPMIEVLGFDKFLLWKYTKRSSWI